MKNKFKIAGIILVIIGFIISILVALQLVLEIVFEGFSQQKILPP